MRGGEDHPLHDGLGDLPDVGTKVVHHHQDAAPTVGQVIERDAWTETPIHPDEFVVEFPENRFLLSLDDVDAKDEVVHYGP